MKKLTVYWTEQNGRSSDDLLRKTAARFAGLPPGECETVRAHGKKPVFRFHPELYASVSHSGGIWACALTTDGPVGLDLQLRTGPKRMEQIARRYFHPAEAAAVFAADDPAEEFTRIWCRKEAAAKQSGRGIDALFGSFCTVRAANEGATGPDGPFDILGTELCLTEFRLPGIPDLYCCTAAPFPHEVEATAQEYEIQTIPTGESDVRRA